MNVWMDAPWGDQRVKREHSTDDSSLFKAASRGSLSLPRGSFGGGGSGGVSRDRAAINTGGKNKRCRSSAADEEKVPFYFALSFFFFQGKCGEENDASFLSRWG